VPGLREVSEDVLPDALLLEAPEEPLDDPVLLWGVRRDELLAQPIVPTGGAEAPALVDQPVVAPNDRGRSRGPQRPEPGQAGLLERTFRLLGPTPAGKLPADALPIMAVEDHGQVGPAVTPAEDVARGRGVTGR
jgi:hypothetical protein